MSLLLLFNQPQGAVLDIYGAVSSASILQGSSSLLSSVHAALLSSSSTNNIVTQFLSSYPVVSGSADIKSTLSGITGISGQITGQVGITGILLTIRDEEISLYVLTASGIPQICVLSPVPLGGAGIVSPYPVIINPSVAGPAPSIETTLSMVSPMLQLIQDQPQLYIVVGEEDQIEVFAVDKEQVVKPIPLVDLVTKTKPKL